MHGGDYGSTDDGNVIGGHDGDELTMVMMVISGNMPILIHLQHQVMVQY
jgi:hypothetical protein